MTDHPVTPESMARADIEANNQAVAGAETIKIGILSPITGPGDPTAGLLTVRGATLGAEYIREHGGIRGGTQVEFVLRNDQETAVADGAMSVSALGAMAKIVVADEVLAVMGPWHLRTSEWVCDIAEQFGVPLFIESGHSFITKKKRRTLFRTYTTVGERISLITRFAQEQGMRRVAILAADTVYGLMSADTFEEEAKRSGYDFEILRINFDQARQEKVLDLSDELRQIKEFAPDLVLNVGVILTNYLIINQAVEVGLLPGTPMAVAFQFPLRARDYWRLAGEHGNLMVWPASRYTPTWDGLTDLGKWFTERYMAKYGDTPPDTALNAFTDVHIIAQALEVAKSISRADLLDALEDREFETWRGPLSFQRNDDHWHHTPPEVILQQYQQVGQDISNVPIVYPPQYRTHEYVRPGTVSS